MKKPKSRECILKEKRERERRRYEAMKNDPVLREKLRKKEKDQYVKKRLSKQVKLVEEMSNRELRAKRKQWRKNSRAYLQRQKIAHNVARHVREDTPPSSSSLPPTSSILVESRKQAGKKRTNKRIAKLTRANCKLHDRVDHIRRLYEKMRKRLYRFKKANSNNILSPQKKVDLILKTECRAAIKKRLLLAESMFDQLRNSFKNLKRGSKKSVFVNFVLGNQMYLRKYKLVHRVLPIIQGKTIRLHANFEKDFRKRKLLRGISVSVRQDVVRFFLEDQNSRITPGKKDLVSKNKVKKQKRFLNDTLRNLHKKFESTSNYKIGYTLFCSLRPFWVLKPNARDRDTCACEIHENMQLLMRGLYNAGVIKTSDPKNLLSDLCCDRYNTSCLLRQCIACKNKQVIYEQFNSSSQVNYQKWMRTKVEYFDKKTNSTKISQKLEKRRLQCSILEGIESFEKNLQKFLTHEGIINNQHVALKSLLMKLNEDEVLLHMDFSENYSCKYSTEIQSYHFGGSRHQITLHTSIIYFRHDEVSQLTKQCFCTLSSDLRHSPSAVWAHLQPVFRFILSKKPHIKKLHLLSDSPSSQYRNKFVFYLLQYRLREIFPALKMATWNYSEAGHGKGVPDGVGGTLKRTADRLVSEGEDIFDFTTFVCSLEGKVRSIILKTVTSSEIDDVETNLPKEIVTFNGTMKVHQVKVQFSPGRTEIAMYKLSRFLPSEDSGEQNFLGSHNALPSYSSTSPHNSSEVTTLGHTSPYEVVALPSTSGVPKLTIKRNRKSLPSTSRIFKSGTKMLSSPMDKKLSTALHFKGEQENTNSSGIGKKGKNLGEKNIDKSGEKRVILTDSTLNKKFVPSKTSKEKTKKKKTTQKEDISAAASILEDYDDAYIDLCETSFSPAETVCCSCNQGPTAHPWLKCNVCSFLYHEHCIGKEIESTIFICEFCQNIQNEFKIQ